jgi:hypothetical protein
MACYIVTFEPVGLGAQTALEERLKSTNFYCPINAHSWAIVTTMSAAQLRDHLAQASPASRIFVVRSGTEGAWRNLYSDKHNEWLKTNL